MPYSPSAADLAAYDRDGYFVTPPLFAADPLTALHEAIERRYQQAIAAAPPERAESVRTRAFIVHNHLCGQPFTGFLRHPAWAPLLSQMLGPEVLVYWSQAIVKPGQVGRLLAWHQDARYAITEPLDPGFTALVAITPMTVANGTVWALPGQHRQGLLPHRYRPETEEWVGEYDTSARVPLELAAGQALIFSRLLPHYSGPNTTAATRISFQIGFARPGVVLLPERTPFGDHYPVLRHSQLLPPEA